MVDHGYKKYYFKPLCLITEKFSDGNFIILLLDVDYMLIVGQNISKIDRLKTELNKSFAIKDLTTSKINSGHENLS